MTGNFGADFNAQASFDASATLDAAADLAASASASLDASLSASLDASLSASLDASFDASLSAGLSAGLGASANSKCRVGAHVPDPWLKFRFKVEIQDIGIVRFKRVESFALRSEQDRSAGQNGAAFGAGIQLPPRTWHWDPVTLKRGMAHDGTAIWKWVEATVKKYPIKTHNVVITLLDAEGKFAMQWTLVRAYPVEWIIEPLDASANEVVIETLKLAHQGVTVQFKGGGFDVATPAPGANANAPAPSNNANANGPGGANRNNAGGGNRAGTTNAGGGNGANRSTTKLGRPPPQPTGNVPTSGGVQSGGTSNHGRNNGT